MPCATVTWGGTGTAAPGRPARKRHVLASGAMCRLLGTLDDPARTRRATAGGRFPYRTDASRRGARTRRPPPGVPRIAGRLPPSTSVGGSSVMRGECRAPRRRRSPHAALEQAAVRLGTAIETPIVTVPTSYSLSSCSGHAGGTCDWCGLSAWRAGSRPSRTPGTASRRRRPAPSLRPWPGSSRASPSSRYSCGGPNGVTKSTMTSARSVLSAPYILPSYFCVQFRDTGAGEGGSRW